MCITDSEVVKLGISITMKMNIDHNFQHIIEDHILWYVGIKALHGCVAHTTTQ